MPEPLLLWVIFEIVKILVLDCAELGVMGGEQIFLVGHVGAAVDQSLAWGGAVLGVVPRHVVYDLGVGCHSWYSDLFCLRFFVR